MALTELSAPAAAATPAPSHAGLVARARELVPVLRERAVETERLRRLPDETLRDFRDAGLMGLMKPRKFGGPELRMDAAMEITAELARGDGSAAWVWVILTCHDPLAAFFPAQAQAEFWSDPDALMASSFAPTGKAEPVEGGYRLSGKWSYCSGVDAADWVMLGAITGMAGPVPRMAYVLVPRSDFTIIDDWHVVGLRGTGSKSVVVEGAFVPAHRALDVADAGAGTAPGGKVHPSPLYRAPMMAFFPFFIASPAAGIARGGLDAFVAEMRQRRLVTGGASAKLPGVQIRLAEAAALTDAADLLYKRSLRETMDVIFAGEPLSPEHRARSRRDQTYAIVLAKRAMELLVAVEGARGLQQDHPVQRAWRDLQAVSAHLVAGWDGPAQLYGEVMLGEVPQNALM
ncbi:MAG TPA: acyl-CoA dehydrogenase family protein [Hyphomicrobiales bacterium]|nr:acyl-CoA dehydrogenase family protein [Hyphomicrobiales bacterium]